MLIRQYDGLPCEIAVGSKHPQGYIRNRRAADRILADGSCFAHRQAAYKYFGPPPTDKPLACHTCDNPACVRESHLFWGSAQDNMTDKMSKGRHRTVSGAFTTELSDDALAEMRRLYATGSYSQRALGRMFGITSQYAGLLLRGLRR